MNLTTILNYTITLVFTVIGALIFIRIWKFVNRELRTAPRYTRFQRFKTRFSAVLFSLLVSLSSIFVLAIVSSAIADNAIRVVQFRVSDDPEFARPILIIVLRAFIFPNLIPYVLIFITIFAFLYSFYEYLSLADQGQGGPMEVQRWIEGKFIDPLHSPWSYFMSFFIFFSITILIPLFTSLITLDTWEIPIDFKRQWVVPLIFMDWLLLGPIFYLSYYARIGATQSFLRARKVNLKKNRSYILIYIAMGLIIISSISALFTYLPILWGRFPDPHFRNETFELIENINRVLEFVNINLTEEAQFQMENFIFILPPDFLWFIITSMGFGLYGFYTKFVSKEPLNSNKMVLFGAYLVCGIAATIFINTIVRWPWFFPEATLRNVFGLNIDLKNSLRDQIFIIRLFSPAILVEKLLNIIFLVHFLFRRKDLRQNAEEWALQQAIQEQDFETVMKYVNHEQAEMRLLVVDSVIRYIKRTDTADIPEETSKAFASILELLVGDEDPTVQQFIQENQDEIISKLEESSLIEGIMRLFSEEEHSKTKQILDIFHLISKDKVDRIERVIRILIGKELTSGQLQIIFGYLKELNETHHAMVVPLVLHYLTPQIAHSHAEIVIPCLDFIKTHAGSFTNDYELLSVRLFALLSHPDPKIVAPTLETLSYISIDTSSHIAAVMREFNVITHQTPEIIRQKIGAIVRFSNIEPKWFPQFFDYIKIYLNQEDPIYKADAALALGSISSNISLEDFFAKIFPYLKNLVQDSDEDVRKSTVSSLTFIAKTQPEILHVEKFQHLFTILMLDSNVDVRHRIYRQYIQLDPYLLLNDIAAVLMTPMSREIRFDLLNTLAQMAKQIGPHIKEVDLISKLLKQDFRETGLLNKHEIENLQADKSRLFGFRRKIHEISIMEATISILYELCYFYPEYYEGEVKTFLEANAIRSGGLGMAKMFEFYSKIALETIDTDRWIPLDINIESTLKFIYKHLFTLDPLSQKVIIDFINNLYRKDSSYHREILEIIYGVIQQTSDPSIESQDKIIRLLAKILSTNGDLYFKKIQLRNLVKYKEVSLDPFNDLFKPYLIKELMPKSTAELQKGIAAALLQIAKTPEKDRIIQDLLIYTIHERDPKIKISGMKALVIMPLKIEQKDILALIKHQLSEKDVLVQATAIDVMAKIIRTYPPITKDTKKRDKRTLLGIIYRTLQVPYSFTASKIVKQTILDNLRTISLIQPEISLGIKLLHDMSSDPDLSISMQAVQFLFDFVDLYPTTLQEEVFVIYRHLANHPAIEIQLRLIERFTAMHRNQNDMSRLLPTVLKLSTNPNPRVRNEGLNAFREIFLTDPDQFNFCINELLSIVRRSKIEIRRDASVLLGKVMIEYSSKLLSNVRVFIALEQLARDYDYQINLIIVEMIPELLEKYPNRYESFLQIIYILLRKSDRKRREITEKALSNLISIVKNSTELKEEIISRLERFFKKNQDPLLENSIERIKAITTE